MTFLFDEKKIPTCDAESISYELAKQYLNRNQMTELINQISLIFGQPDWVKEYIFLAVKYKIEDFVFSRGYRLESVEKALSEPVCYPSVELFAGSIRRLLAKGEFINKIPYFDSDFFGINRHFLKPKSPNNRILVTIRDGLDEDYANDLWFFDGSRDLLDHAIFLEIGRPNWATCAKKMGIGYFSTRMGLLKSRQSCELFKSLRFNGFCIEEKFIKNIVAVLVYSVFYWKRLYSLLDIRLTIEGEERQFSPFFKKLAAYSYDGVGPMIGIQRSESYFPNKTLGPEIARDVYYAWSRTFEVLHTSECFPKKVIVSIPAHLKKSVNSQMDITIDHEPGKKLVVGFDNIYGNLGNPITESAYEKFISFFVDLLFLHEDINALIKLKSPRNALHPVFSLNKKLIQLIDDDRLTLWTEPRTDILKFESIGCLFIGMGVSSAVSQLGLRGYNAVNFDVMGSRLFHPLYKEPYHDVIFDSSCELLSKCGDFLSGKLTRLGYWPEPVGGFVSQPDSFKSVIRNLLVDGNEFRD